MCKSIFLGLIFIIIVSGCSKQRVVSIRKDVSAYVTVSSNAYFLSNQKLTVMETEIDGKIMRSYYVNNELELVKAIQYNIENNMMEIAYQSAVKIDLDIALEMLSRLNPFDLSLKQTATYLKDKRVDSISSVYLLKVENLDEKYNENLHNAKIAVQELQLEDKDMSEKINRIHRYILQNSSYDDNLDAPVNRDSFSAYGVFTSHKAVCTGYSRAFMMIAREANVPALFVVSKKMNHSWNYVYDGNTWKYIDTTWDDLMTGVDTQKYLRMGVEEFKNEGKHEFDHEEEDLLKELSDVFL